MTFNYMGIPSTTPLDGDVYSEDKIVLFDLRGLCLKTTWMDRSSKEHKIEERTPTLEVGKEIQNDQETTLGQVLYIWDLL